MFLFGISYAVASLSCTIPVFLIVVTGAFAQGEPFEGLVVFAAYAAGMAIVLIALTVALALARQGLVTRLRRLLPYITRISGGLLVLAGIFLTYYGWWERQVLSRDAVALSEGSAADRPAELALEFQQAAVQWVDGVGPIRLGLILLGAVVAVVVVVRLTSRRREDQRSSV